MAQVVSILEQERFSGPIAHPKHLREYESILLGSADRIIKMAEGNLEHGRSMQSKAIQADIDDTKAGRFYGFITFVILILCAVWCIWMGSEVGAGLFLGAAALGAVSKLIDGRAKKAEAE